MILFLLACFLVVPHSDTHTSCQELCSAKTYSFSLFNKKNVAGGNLDRQESTNNGLVLAYNEFRFNFTSPNDNNTTAVSPNNKEILDTHILNTYISRMKGFTYHTLSLFELNRLLI
ncbi:MAG: hypothetical protein LBL74_02905 [Bacteroidales bacterium]|nr:hypothetical protein [Bacteroidales bacterium]